ncbi:MAG: molybdate ABC transporter substrate-binding protein [Campylobacterales bacterium]|nr:molybdate ABC transporter substrate-binding protein [Campylobacterales bacterium]HEO99012.1 molybdate ABC transporter substrate-binding protein [Campylobacterota bacterium]
MKKFVIVFFMGLSLLSAGEIKVALAANVGYAIEDLKEAFHLLYPDTKVQVTLGSSGKLTAQIMNGAPYQLFISADMTYPEALYKEGIAVTRPLVYAQGSLAYLSSREQDFTKGITLTKDAAIQKIAVANPQTAPYGKAALEAMKNGGVLEEVEKKFVYAESISQTVSYAVTAADIGFIAKSSLYSPKMAHFKEGVNWKEVDPKLYTPIDQGMVVLKNGEKNSEVAAFYAFMFSAKAKKILQNYGYLVP